MASKKISSLSVVLGAATSPFTKGFAAAGTAVTSLQSKVGSLAGSVAKWTGIGAAISGLVGGVGLSALVSQQMDAIDANAKLSDRLGISTEALAGLQHAGDLAGISSEQLTGGLEKMLKSLATAATDGGAAADVFNNLGLDATKLANVPTDQAFTQIADALKNIENPAQRAKAAMDIFGKSGQDLLPLMMSGADGIKEAMKEADALGLSFNRVDAGNVEQANDAISRVKASIVGVGRTLAIALAPYITKAADYFTGWGIRIVAIVKTYLPVAISYAQSAFNTLSGIVTGAWNAIYAFVAPIVSSIVTWISINWQTMLTTAVGYWMAIYDLVKTVLTLAWTAVSAIGSAIASVWFACMDALGVQTVQTGNTVGNAFATIETWTMTLMSVVTTAINGVTYSIQNFGQLVDVVGLTVAYNLVKIGNEFAYIFTTVIPGILSWFAANWQDIFTTVWNFYKSVWTNIATNTANFASALWSFLKGDGFNFEWTGLLTGFENTVKQMPAIADRVAGPLEEALGNAAADASNKFGEGLGNAIAAKQQAAADATKGLMDGVANALKFPDPKIPDIKAPVPPPPVPIDVDTDALNKGLKDVGKNAKASADAVKLVFANSAEAMQMHAQAGFAAAVAGTVAKPAPTDAPIARGAAQAARENVAQRKTEDAGMITVLRAILAELKGSDRIEFREGLT